MKIPNTWSLGDLNGQSKTTKDERADLIELLESKTTRECRELWEFVSENKSEFTQEEVEVYRAASKVGGLRRLKVMDKKKERARKAGLKLSQLKKGAFEDDAEWEALVGGDSYGKAKPKKVHVQEKAQGVGGRRKAKTASGRPKGRAKKL